MNSFFWFNSTDRDFRDSGRKRLRIGLIRQYLVDEDDPVTALEFLDEFNHVDKRTQELLPKAVLAASDLTLEDHLALGQWYYDLWLTARQKARPAMANRTLAGGSGAAQKPIS